jgi:hypothetical protein
MEFVKKGASRYDGFVDGFEIQHHQGGALIMKFKQSDGQNQRIERIIPAHLGGWHRYGEGNSRCTGYEFSWHCSITKVSPVL